MSRRWTLLNRDTSDRGSVLVAAVAVALIGIALTIVVVAQAIVVTNSSARDRIRTIEVHSAESGLDAAMSQMATSTPCSLGPVTVGSGATATTVTVTMKYFDKDDNQLACASGVVTGTPDRATLMSTSTAVNPGSGVAPKRSFEASVDLTPKQDSTPGDAIFASGGMTVGKGLTLLPEDPTKPAGMWIEAGNYVCNETNSITGSLYVLTGGVEMSNNSCRVIGDVWAKTRYLNHSNVSSGWQVTGDVYVKSGTFNTNNPIRIGGDVMASGNVVISNSSTNILNNNHWKNSVFGGSVCAANISNPCGTIPDMVPRGIPKVEYKLSDWQPTAAGQNFQVKYKADFAEAMIVSFDLHNLSPTDYSNTWKPTSIRANPCLMPGSYMSTKPIKLPAPGVTTPTVYDMRDCQVTGTGKIKVDGSGMQLQLYADVAIFANSIEGASSLNVTSGDGQPHKLWLIVPFANGAAGTDPKSITVGTQTFNYDPGNLTFKDNGLNNSDGLLDIFLYTPEKAHLPSFSVFHGQIWAKTVEIDAGARITYAPVGVPGVSLTNSSSSNSGFDVALSSKREVKQ